VKLEQAPKVKSWTPTRPLTEEGSTDREEIHPDSVGAPERGFRSSIPSLPTKLFPAERYQHGDSGRLWRGRINVAEGCHTHTRHGEGAPDEDSVQEVAASERGAGSHH
jgi:hypothetical protein